MLQSGHGRRDRRTDRRTDGRTDGRSETNIPPNNFVVRGYNNQLISPREIWIKFKVSNFQTNLRHWLWNCPEMNDLTWCLQATSHYLSQCWSIAMSPSGVTRPQWVEMPIFWEYNVPLYMIHIICCAGMILCMELHRIPLTFHTIVSDPYTLKNIWFYTKLKFWWFLDLQASFHFLNVPEVRHHYDARTSAGAVLTTTLVSIFFCF